MSQGHDARYKWVFSHPLFVEKFLRSFVRLPFVKKLNFEAMERVDKEFVSEEFRTLESDIVYKVPYRESCIYIFLLIEFQSTVDKTMPFRFLRYTGELYRFAKPGSESGLYPATFPILLYNGDDEWNVPCNTAELIEKSIPAGFIPRFRYFPVLINQFSKRSLVKIRNVVSAMFFIENSKPAELEAGMDELVGIIQNEETESLKILARWFNGYLQNITKRTIDIDADALYAKITSPMEVRHMFATKLREHEEALITKGKIEGKIESARRMLAEGLSIDLVSKCSGLTQSEVENLKNNKG
ncbi:MAG TPA: Rpn family recombination-promoting nuclease/putative transposase [Spirochaetota bacterium]|nr:Rpn family recombination-promoting nuclease/putative transposase [Spirochaetota bacterium]